MKLRLATFTVITIILLSACAPATMPSPTQDVNAIYTAAAKTVVAEFTLTAASFSPTPPLPTATATIGLATATGSPTATGIVVTDPTLIVADEPTGDLDSKSASEVLDLLGILREHLHKTIIMVTHDPHAAERSHRVVHLDKGLLREDAT